MSTTTKKVSVSLTPLKTILIGVVTTVLGTLIVTKVINSPKRATKNATIEAWASVVKFESISENNQFETLCKDGLEDRLEDIIYEEDQLVKNYEIIKNKQNIDENLVIFLNHAIGQETEQKKIFEDYLKNYRVTQADAFLYETEKKAKYDSLDNYYSRKIDLLHNRNEDALVEIYKTLADRYGAKNFQTPEEEIIVRKNDVTGKWKEVGIDKIFEINDDGTFIMTRDGTDYPVTWQLNNNRLTLSFNDKSGALNFLFTKLHRKFLRFTITNDNSQRQLCRQ